MDLFLATVVFVGIMLSFLTVWQYAQAKSTDKNAKSDIALQAHAALNALVQTAGDPPSWEDLPTLNQSAVHSLGLAVQPFSLSSSKLARLAELNATNYADYKVLLGLQGYEFDLQVYPWDGAQGQFLDIADVHVGKSPPASVSELVAEERVVAEGTQWKRVVLEVWKP